MQCTEKSRLTAGECKECEQINFTSFATIYLKTAKQSAMTGRWPCRNGTTL